ncbi:MAG TPA: hypothetical protein VMJ35_05600 [Dongiaceae bacterium]|nr:hypothetical protein [Dongiaceae bacterium]
MSRKLGAIALVLAVLVCSMELKSALSGGAQNHATVLMANGPDPMPQGPPPGKKSGKYHGSLLVANGPDPMPQGPPPGKKSGN